MYYCFNSSIGDIYYLRDRKGLVSVEGSCFKAFLCSFVSMVMVPSFQKKWINLITAHMIQSTDTTQTYNNGVLSCTSTCIRIKTLPSAPQDRHAPPHPSILPDTFRTARRGREDHGFKSAHVAVRLPPMGRVGFGEAGRRIHIRGDSPVPVGLVRTFLVDRKQ